jgi:hypothetical protein
MSRPFFCLDRPSISLSPTQLCVSNPPMHRRIASITLLLLATTVFAASPRDFSAAAAESAKKAKTTVGGQYGVKFMRSIASSVGPAFGACVGGDFASGSKYDAVFIVSASGRVERVVQGGANPYSDCFSSHLRLPASVAKPPSGHWPVHVCVLQAHPKEAPSSFGCSGFGRSTCGGWGGHFRCFR